MELMRVVGIVLLALFSTAAAIRGTEPSQAVIVVNNADTVRSETSQVAPSLSGLLAAVAERAVVDGADRLRSQDAVAPPPEMRTGLGSLAPRLIFDAADRNRGGALVYPRELLNDRVAAVVSDVEVTPLDKVRVLVTWTTNEFAVCELAHFRDETRLGVLSEALFLKSHQRTITNLEQEVAYRIEVRCTDLADNQSPVRTQTFELAPTCYALTREATPPEAGTVAVSPEPNCSGRYREGTVVQLTAQPGSGYLFDRWSGDAGGREESVAITMSEDRSVTAQFVEAPPILDKRVLVPVLSR